MFIQNYEESCELSITHKKGVSIDTLVVRHLLQLNGYKILERVSKKNQNSTLSQTVSTLPWDNWDERPADVYIMDKACLLLAYLYNNGFFAFWHCVTLLVDCFHHFAHKHKEDHVLCAVDTNPKHEQNSWFVKESNL